MRKLGLVAMTVLAAGVATLANSAPAKAYDYPWCVQGRIWGYPGDCAYATYEQCMARASGTDAYCGINPYVAFARVPENPPPVYRKRYHNR